MNKAERAKPQFAKPRHKMFRKKDYKKTTKAKVFGITATTCRSMVCPSPLYPKSKDWIKIFCGQVAPSLQGEFPGRQRITVLLGGENVMHTAEAKAAMQRHGARLLPQQAVVHASMGLAVRVSNAMVCIFLQCKLRIGLK